MNDEMIELCAGAKRRRDKALADTGAARHQGFYIGEILAERFNNVERISKVAKLIAQVVRDYKSVPDTLAAIADGLET